MNINEKGLIQELTNEYDPKRKHYYASGFFFNENK